MEQDLTTTQIQIISETGALVDDFKYRAKEPDLAKFGKDYHIVSIIGNQSTGKSTLLNKVFGTTFHVMDASRVRKQTTKGILISKDQEKNILVLDVEGADSKERWEGHEPFEQCTALFSLVLSQVLMINIWTQEVGRFKGSNYDVLKVIFETNLKLFKQEGLKKLVFILRDYDDSENPETLKDTIRKDVARIWAEITKPKEYIASTPEQFFEFEFLFLTSFKFARQVFEQQTKAFRQRFIDPSHSDYFFRQYDTMDNVPIDGLYLLMENVWTTIKDCKDINLPGQKTLVANLRCTDIKNDIINFLEGRIKELKDKASKGIYAGFGEEGEQIIKQALDLYDTQTENYEEAVVAAKRKELVSSLLQSLHESFEVQLSAIRKSTITELTSQLDEVKVNPNNLGNVMENVRAVQNKVTERFENALRKVVVASSGWNIELVRSEVKEQIESVVVMFKEKQLAHLLRQKGTEIRRDIEAQITRLFNNLNNDFWTVLQNFYNETVRAAEGFVRNMLSDSFELSSEHVRSQVKILNEDAYKDLETDLKNRFQDLEHFMLKKFRVIFGQNENRVPISWKNLTQQQVSDRYVAAKRECETLLEDLKYFNIRKRGEDYLEKRPVLSEREIMTIAERLNEDYEHEYNDAERKRASREARGTPKLLWAALIFFMYDDVLRWFNNPLIVSLFIYPLFFILCMIALVFAIGYGPDFMSMFSSLLGVLKMLLGGQLRKLKTKL